MSLSSAQKKWLLIVGGILTVVVVALAVYVRQLSPKARDWVIRTLEERFDADVELASLDLKLLPTLRATGEGLKIRKRDRPELPPFLEVGRFETDASLSAVLGSQVRISTVRLEGLRIAILAKEDRVRRTDPPQQPKKDGKKRDVLVDNLVADGTLLTIMPKQPGREPQVYDIRKLSMRSIGTEKPWQYTATLHIPRPAGDVQAHGEFGPWNTEDKGATPVSGTYQLRNADLGVFKGIGGVLASDGKFTGELGRIDVNGTTDTPDFSVDVSGLPIHLKTRFHAIVDGTNGDTLLQPVDATLGRSKLHAVGGIVHKEGVKGKTVDLNATMTDSRIEDVMRLAVKSPKPPMTGAIAFKSRILIPPGPERVIKKLRLDGAFEMDAMKFTSFNVQRRIDEMSKRARGDIKEEETERVVSDLQGRFRMAQGAITFPQLSFVMPGAHLELAGTYGITNEALAFDGTLRMQAKVSQLVRGYKSLLLKLADPFFKKKGAGAVISLKIEGTRADPKFRLVLRKKKAKRPQEAD